MTKQVEFDIDNLTTWKKRDLTRELKAVRWQIDNSSYGRYELYLEENLCRELDRRESE